MHTPPSNAAIPSSSRLLVGRRPPLPLLRRSSSLRSRRSVTSTGSSSSATVATTASGSKRVSFHRDVRVKRIPSYLGERGRFGSGSFKRRHRPAPSPPPDPSAGLVRRLDPPHSRQALAKEARKVLREADRVTCTTLPLPKGGGGGGGGKAAIPLLLLNRRKHRRAQPPPRLLISPPLPPQSSAGAPLPAVVTFSSEEGGGASTTDYSSLERPPRERRKKKALSPIIEATTPVIAGPASVGGGDYFSARSNGGESRSIPKDSAAREDGGASGDSLLLRSSGRAESSLDSLTKEDFKGEEGEEISTLGAETLTGGKMVHSSQMPAERPPLTRGTVTGLAQQLSITRRPKGPPPVVGRGYATTLMDAYGTDDHIVNHNNNRPFSYTDPSAVQATLAKSAAHPRNGVDSDGIGGLDQRIPRGGKEVIYAQVVVSGREGGGGGGEGGGPSSRTGGGGVKRTVHTSVLNHQRVEKVPVVVAAEGAGRIYSRPKGRKRLGSEGEEEEEEEEDYEEEKAKAAGEEEEEDEGIAGDMMRIGGGGGVGAGGVTSTSFYSHHHRSTTSRAADSGKVDYVDGDYRNRRHAKPTQKGSDPRRIENYKKFDDDYEDDLLDRTYRRGSLDYGLNKTDNFNKGLGYNRKDLFDSGIENDSGVGGSGRRRPKTGGKVTVGEGVTAKIVMNGGPNLRPSHIGGSCNNISRVTITNDSPGLSGSKDRFFYYGASPEDSTTLQDKRRGSGSTTTTVTNSKGANVTSSSMASTRLVRAAEKRRDADLPTSSVLIRHWAPSSDEKHSGHDQQLIAEGSKIQETYYHRERRRRRRRTSEGYEEEEEEEVEERNGHPQDGDDGHYRRPRAGKEKGKGRLEDLEEEEQRVNGKEGSHSDVDDYDERNNNTTVTSSSRRYQKKGEAALKKKTTSAVYEEEDQYAADKKGKGKKGEKEGEEKKKRGFRHLFSRKSGSGAKETTEEKGGVTGEYHKSTYDRRKDRTDGYASAEDRRSHGHSTNHDPSGRHKDRWFSEDEIDRRNDRTPPSRRKYTADGHSSSATLSRLVANNNRKNKVAATNSTASDTNSGGRWFKSLDRLTRRKNKEDEDQRVEQAHQKESTPPAKADGAAHGGNKKNLRFFGDTDQESVTSGNQRTARNGTRRPVGIMASGRRSGASEEEESGTTTESSAPSQRSVYLHAATVGDIPGPAKTATPAAQPAALSKTTKKKAGSREELQQRRPVVTNKTTLSRSVSVLAPWRPRYKPGSNVDVHYDSSGAYTPNPNGNGGMVTGRPPKAPRTANGNGGVRSSRGMSASVESLQRGGTKKASPPRQATAQRPRDGRDSALRSERRQGSSRRDIHKVGVERVHTHDAPTRGSSGVTVTRSASMPKDSRLAGWWFRRKKVGQATGKENYGGSANRG